MKRAFVAGWPISHSLSPALHSFWLRRYDIAGSYEPVAVRPEDFAAFLTAIERAGFAGGNITIPHKLAALGLCSRIDEAARQIGAVNTVWLEDGALIGSNTDSYGFAAALDAQAPQWPQAKPALVLGAGGAARAIVHALLSRGVKEIVVVNRSRGRADALAAAFPDITVEGWENCQDLVGQSLLIVNTTSLGMTGYPPLEIELSACRPETIVADIVYNPLRTGLLCQAQALGLRAVDGLGMLMHQAVPGFERWFGRRPVVDSDLRDHLLAILRSREKEIS